MMTEIAERELRFQRLGAPDDGYEIFLLPGSAFLELEEPLAFDVAHCVKESCFGGHVCTSPLVAPAKTPRVEIGRKSKWVTRNMDEPCRSRKWWISACCALSSYANQSEVAFKARIGKPLLSNLLYNRKHGQAENG
jgi:hypothetical protein